MINQRYCPFCKAPARQGCEHLALAVEGRDFVRRCVERCHGQIRWRTLCVQSHQQQLARNEWSPEQEDFTWLETAFCERFLKHLGAFGGMEYEWRSGPKPEQGGFWVLVWSPEPRRLWWELHEELERQSEVSPAVPDAAPWLIYLNPKG